MKQFANILTSSTLSLALAAVLATASQAGVRQSFIVPPADGYGIGDCLASGGACGRLVADSWCEAKGLASAESFGRADDVTAAIPSGNGGSEQLPPGTFIINCRD